MGGRWGKSKLYGTLARLEVRGFLGELTMPTARLLANALRALSMDAVQKANSGHPGAPMGMADIAQVLWGSFLKHNPADPAWPNRDRFVLSNGHASMLLYSLLHLTGYPLSLNDLGEFRQLHSKTPGHPELGITPGVETTTGPLGQGVANAVGMALAEKMLGAEFNRPDFPIIDHYTYVFLGDGCLMEGISHEVSSLAGTWALNKLIAFWDDNGISIDGEVEGWFNEDIPQRFRAYGWHVIEKVDGHSPEEIKKAIDVARLEQEKPTLICCKTKIGFGAPTKAGTEGCHGSPLGLAEIEGARKALDWPYAPFEIPADVAKAWDARPKGAMQESSWQNIFEAYRLVYPELATAFEQRLRGELPNGLLDRLTALAFEKQEANKSVASRKSSQEVLQVIAPLMPELLGGSADLTGSNLTKVAGSQAYLHYGVREFGMGAIMNGLSLYGGYIPYGGTFLTFIDYAKNSLRLAALMNKRVIWVLTHDSIGLGEDGPTHQPIEHLSSLRATPNVHTWRPADAVETVIAWRESLKRENGPTCLILSRQNLPTLAKNNKQIELISRGGYILLEPEIEPEIILIATGSEVALCCNVATELAEAGIGVRVVSLPCWEQFEQNSKIYQAKVLPAHLPKIAVEAGSTLCWWKYCRGQYDSIIGIDRFGESAPAESIFEILGFTVENIKAKIKSTLTSIKEGVKL
jgi:transketolase